MQHDVDTKAGTWPAKQPRLHAVGDDDGDGDDNKRFVHKAMTRDRHFSFVICHFCLCLCL